MKKLKTLILLGLFALVSIPLKAQPPNWPDIPPADMPANWDPGLAVSPDIFWTTINNTDCDIDFSNWFNVLTNETGGPVITPYNINFSMPANSSGSVSTSTLMQGWLGSPPYLNSPIIVGAGVLISIGGSGWIPLLPGNPPNTKVHVSGASSPCDCFRYTFDFSDPTNYKLIINPVVFPDTCP
jgi:hypothetical protein